MALTMASTINPENSCNFKLFPLLKPKKSIDFNYSFSVSLDSDSDDDDDGDDDTITFECDALPIPRLSSTKRTYPVRKVYDMPDDDGRSVTGSLLAQMKRLAIAAFNEDSGGGGIDGESGSGDGGGSDNGNGGNDDGDGNGDVAGVDAYNNYDNRIWRVWIEKIKVHGIAIYDDGTIHRSPITEGDAYAYEYHSWQEIGNAMLDFWLDQNDYDELDYLPEIPFKNPNLSCPGSVTFFGRYEGEVFYDLSWELYTWDAVKLLVKDIVVLRLVEGVWKKVN